MRRPRVAEHGKVVAPQPVLLGRFGETVEPAEREAERDVLAERHEAHLLVGSRDTGGRDQH